MIRVAWGIKGRNTVHHWVFHVFPASCPGPHCYGILATGTKKPGHHKEQEVHFSAGLVFSVLYFFRCRPCVFLLDFHSFPSRSAADSVLYLSASLSLALVHTLHSFSLPRRLSLTLSQPLNLSPALVSALPRLLLTQRTETTGEVFLSRSLSFFFFKKRSVCGVKSFGGLLAAAGKVCSRNVGQSDLESEHEDTRPEMPCSG